MSRNHVLKMLKQMKEEIKTIYDPDEPVVFLSFVDTGNDQVTERLRDRLEEDPKNKRQKIFIVYEETYEQYGLIKVIDPTDPSLSAWHDVGKGLKERLEKQIQQPISQQEKDQKLSTLKEKIVEVKKRVKVEKDAKKWSVLLLKFHFTSKWIVTEGKSQGPEQSNKIPVLLPIQSQETKVIASNPDLSEDHKVAKEHSDRPFNTLNNLIESKRNPVSEW